MLPRSFLLYAFRRSSLSRSAAGAHTTVTPLRVWVWLSGLMPGAQYFYGARPILFRGSFRTSPALPELISELCQSVPLIGFVSEGVDALPEPRARMLVCQVQVSLIRVLKA